MESSKYLIPLDQYPRRALYRFFSEKSYPVFSTTSRIDIGKFKQYTKQYDLPFFISLSFLLNRVCNSIPEFKHRIIDKELYAFDVLHTSFTIAKEEGAYGFSDVSYEEDFESYKNKAALCIERIKQGVEAAPEDAIDKQQSVLITTIPWFDFSSFSQPYDSVYGSIPVITLGKYTEQNAVLSMAVALQVHHAVMDGYHAGLFYARLQAFLNEPEKCFNLSAILTA